MAPLVRFVFPVPGPRWIRMSPVPAFSAVPAAIAITAAPGSRSALTTPEDSKVLA